MNRTALRGHALRSEGAAYRPGDEGVLVRVRWNSVAGDGVGACECGAASRVLGSAAARRRWHAAHKDEIRQARP